jgi:hypothetical protein
MTLVGKTNAIVSLLILLVRFLQKAQIPYMVIGGFAILISGSFVSHSVEQMREAR